MWRHGLLLKLTEVIKDLKMINLFDSMLSNRFLQVCLNNKSSHWRCLNDGLPQGSVLSPILFSLYVADLPLTNSMIFQFADDIALTFQASSFEVCEEVLNGDLITLSNYFKSWGLKPNPSKSEACCFHLNNREANRELRVVFENIFVPNVFFPKYLGVTLDRTLSYKNHIEKLSKKLSSRVNIIRKLAGTNWGADAETLKISSTSLVYSCAEYGAPVWLNSSHTHKVDVQLNNAMRIITGALKSTPLPWLPVLSNIEPPALRRESACRREFSNCHLYGNSLLHDVIQEIPENRLNSRNPPWKYNNNESFNVKERWKNDWNCSNVTNAHLINDPSERVNGFNLKRSDWVKLNRFRTGHGRCAYNMHKWGMSGSPLCSCGDQQTMNHLINDCPLYKFSGGLNQLHEVTPDAVTYLKSMDLKL